MTRFYTAQQGHVVNILPPVDINGGANTDVFSMKEYGHATIIIQFGVTGAASTVTVYECDDFTPSNATAIAFNYFAETASGGDTLSALTAATTAGFATSTNDNIMYVIELDAAELSDGYPCVQVRFSNPGASTIVSAVAVLSGARYASDQSATVIA